MGFRLNVKGQNEEILLEKESILDVKYISETPDDSNARATDLGVILEIRGKYWLRLMEKKQMTQERWHSGR